MKRLICSCALLALLGCSTIKPTSDSISQSSQVYRDQYTKQTIISAPRVPLDGIIEYCQLVAVQNPAGAIDYSLLYKRSGPAWMFASVAHSSDGDRFDVKSINGSVYAGMFGAGVNESCEVKVPRAYLDRSAEKGLDIRIDGSNGQRVIQLRDWYIRGFLDKVDQAK